jgi:hypothetical protein
MFMNVTPKKVQNPFSIESKPDNKQKLNDYRIYSRKSREILANFWPIFFQFDLNAARKSCDQNWFISLYFDS